MRETDLRDLLIGTADAAFATSLDGVIRIWNQGAERLVVPRATRSIDSVLSCSKDWIRKVPPFVPRIAPCFRWLLRAYRCPASI